MADNTIDTLAIEVSGDVSSASISIKNLNDKLDQLSSKMYKNVKSFRHFSSAIGAVNSAAQSLNGLNFGRLGNAVTQLERLSRIDLSNLQDKSVNVDIKLNSADAASNLKYSIEKSLDATKIDVSALSKQLTSAFELKGGAASKLQRQVNLLAKQLTASFDGQDFQAGEWGKTLDDIGKTIVQSGSVVKSNLGGYLSGAEQEWQDFYNYFKNKKIYVSDMLKFNVGKGEFRELLQSYLGNITTDISKGINLNSMWSELSDRFPTLIPKDTISDADQLITVLENLKKTRDSIKPVSIQSLFGEEAGQASDLAYSSVVDTFNNLTNAIKKNISSAMQSANGQIPIDVKVNEDKIVRDIRNAINRSSTLNYDPIKVNLSVNTSDIKAGIESKLNGLDLSSANEQLNQFSQSISRLSNLNMQNSGLNSSINAIRRLNESLSADNGIPEKINRMISALSTLGTIPDVSNNVNRFVSSLARLANSSTPVESVVANLDAIGNGLKDVATKISSIGDISSPVNAFVQSISQLASAGDKTGKTAEQLESLAISLKSFFQAMSSAPNISSNTIKMTQALAQLANSGRNVEKATRSTTNAFKGLGSGASSAVPKLKRFGNAVGNIGTKAKKSIPSLMSLIAKFWTLKFVASKFWGAIEKSMNFLEDYNYFQSAFNQVASKAGDNWKEAGYSSAEEYAESFSKRARELTSKMSGFDISDNGTLSANKSGKSLGMDPSMLLDYQATFAQISSSMGNTSDQAEKLSKALTMIGADLASVKNLDFKEVYENMSSGLVGMSRAVDKYGANIRAANLQQVASNLGIQTSVSKMDQASKAMLRTIVILDSTRYAWADLANTINDGCELSLVA